MTTVNLTRPITAHGVERRVIELREPNGADIIACGGNPSSGGANANNRITIINAGVVADYISRLGEIPPSSINQLGPIDWMRCQNAILDFFREPDSDELSEPNRSESSTAISMSPGSGNGALEPPLSLR